MNGSTLWEVENFLLGIEISKEAYLRAKNTLILMGKNLDNLEFREDIQKVLNLTERLERLKDLLNRLPNKDNILNQNF